MKAWGKEFATMWVPAEGLMEVFMIGMVGGRAAQHGATTVETALWVVTTIP
jgi:hypothetical protein